MQRIGVVCRGNRDGTAIDIEQRVLSGCRQFPVAVIRRHGCLEMIVGSVANVLGGSDWLLADLDLVGAIGRGRGQRVDVAAEQKCHEAQAGIAPLSKKLL